MESSTIKNKILLVLSKTEKALLADVQSEFLPLQKTMENEAKRLEESNSQFTDCKMLINAVFTQVGYDISHLEHTEELITEFSKVLASIDKLLKVLDENSGKDWIEKSENIFAAVKDFTGAMDGLLDTETDKVLDELQEVCEETKKKLFNRTLIKRILEHILITLLKNVRVVFADEIEFLRLLTESGVKSLEELSTLVQNNMSDAVGRFEALCERIGKKELAEIISEVNEAKDAINYEEIVHILNAAYAVLSFFGLIKEKTVELKVPNAILEKISTAGQDVNGLLVEIKNGGKDIAEGLDEIDKKISQVAITAGVMNVGIASLAEKESSINKYIDETETAVTNGTKKLASISIPVKILVFRWECFPKLFTSPYKYLQDLYPVNDVEDAQQLLVRIINVARAINPDIPDYSSLKNLLYSLLKQLENKVITMVENNEAVKETVRQIKTFIDEVKSLIEMLEEVAKDVRANLKVILETYNNVLLLLSKDLNDTLKAVSDAGDEIKETCIDAFNQLDKEVRENAETLYNELQKQLPEMNLKIDFTSLENEIKSVIVADINLLASDGTKTLQATDLDGCFEKLDKNLQTWSEDTYKDIYKKISPATWDKRISDTFSVLQAEFGNDMQLVSRLFSKKGAKDLISDFDGTTNKIFTQLDITDYVHIITTAVEEVILPDPVRYYDDFCEKVFKASLPSDEKLMECIAKIGKTGDDAEKIIKEIPSQIWDIVRKEVIGKLLSYIKEILLKALREVLNKYMEQKLAKDVFSAFGVQSKDVEKIASLGEDIRDYLVSGMKFGDTVKLLKKVYEDIPSGVKDAVGNLFPDLPSNDFFDYVKDMDVQVDLDNSFFVATVFDAKSSYKTDDAKTDISGKIQVCAFVKDGGLYIYPVIDAGTKVAIPIKNYQLTIGAEGSMNASAKGADGTKGDMIGVFLTKGTRHAFNGSIEEEWKALSGWLTLTFSRKENSEALKLFDTTYLGLTLKDFPQMIFFGYGTDLPKTITESISKKSANGNLDFGYKGMIKDAEVIIHAKKMGAFFEQVFKDDVKVPFSTYIWYDFRNGFDFGGDARLKVDVDLHQLKIGNITFDKLDIELGSKKGKLFSNFLQDFSVDFKGMVLAFEGFGLDLKLKGFNSDSFLQDLGLELPSFSIKGGGLTIDCAAVKGSGLISYDNGEITGVVQLTVAEEFGISGFIQCDMGTASGHSFNLVILMSAYFNPGIPLGLGFSLTAAGGVVGLNRKIDRDKVSQGCRNGTLGSVFFVQNLKDHLAEMKSSITSYFPDKKNQFFFGMLAQISYEPVVRVSLGLLLQLPKPVEIIIVGAVNISIKGSEDIIQINVYFAGGINFEQGIWFDASIVDSHIAGIELFGDMAFRLFWGGESKGFLISVGGFHPSYTPEKGLMVSNMKRVGMQLKMSPLKLSLETYLAVTSNTFQIGAHLDIFVGWKQFNISGYASFDCLFQFDPFEFQFDLRAGVAVTMGKTKILSIDLSLNVIGPCPWKINVRAKFTFLFIPIPIGFSLEFGHKKQALPSKTVEVYPLLLREIQNQKNWTCKSNSLMDNMVIVGELVSDMLIVQPCDSIIFRQSVVPFCKVQPVGPEELGEMEMFNGALPTDYDYIAVSCVEVGDKVMTKQDETVDFAPSLFKNLSTKEKLKLPSYEKWCGGFSLSEMNNCVADPHAEVKAVEYKTNSNPKTLIINGNDDENQIIKENTHRLNPDFEEMIHREKNQPVNTEQKVVTDYVVSSSAYTRRDKSSFERYMNILDRKLQENGQLAKLKDL